MARREGRSVLLSAAALGAITGMRAMAAPALLAHELAEAGNADEFGRLERFLTSERTARLLALLAGGEMLADKTAFVPDRTSPVPLITRVIIGSGTAAAFAIRRRESPLLPATVGAAAAAASTFAAFHFRRFARRRFHVPDRFVGMLEDAFVVAASKAIVEVGEV